MSNLSSQSSPSEVLVKPKCACGTSDAPKVWCYIHGYILATTHDAVTVKLPKFPKGIEKLKIPLDVLVGKTWQLGKSKLKPGSTGDIMCYAFLKLARENKNIVTYEQCAVLCPAYPGDPVAWARQAGAEIRTEKKNRRYVVVKYV